MKGFTKGRLFSTVNTSGNTSAGSVPSIIASDCRMTGNIKSSGEIFIDGEIDDVRCATAIVGKNGSVRQIIEAEVVRVHGSVTGQIVAAVVEIAETAQVVADIECGSLSIAAGAHVEGRCKQPAREPVAINPDSNALMVGAGIVP